MIGPLIKQTVSWTAEKYVHGIIVGFGIYTANRIIVWKSVLAEIVPTVDWRSIRDRVKDHPDEIWSWRKKR